MTAEVAVLNRGAIALAADSASTVTYWENGKPNTRFFKTANKIFHISNKYPVGLMLYDAGSLQGMPWEVIAKSYRERRGNTPQNELENYAKDLFDFIVTDGHLFPPDYQEKQLISAIEDTFLRICNVIGLDHEDESKAATPEARAQIVKNKLSYFANLMRSDDFIDDITEEFVDRHCAAYYEQVFKKVSETALFRELNAAVEPRDIFALAAIALFKQRWTTLQMTGLVIAGYGENQYFPHLHHYNCYGVLLGKLLCTKIKKMT